MLSNTVNEGKRLSDGTCIDEAIEIHPLAAMIAPRFPAEVFANTGGDDRLLERLQMFAGHFRGFEKGRQREKLKAYGIR